MSVQTFHTKRLRGSPYKAFEINIKIKKVPLQKSCTVTVEYKPKLCLFYEYHDYQDQPVLFDQVDVTSQHYFSIQCRK